MKFIQPQKSLFLLVPISAASFRPPYLYSSVKVPKCLLTFYRMSPTKRTPRSNPGGSTYPIVVVTMHDGTHLPHWAASAPHGDDESVVPVPWPLPYHGSESRQLNATRRQLTIGTKELKTQPPARSHGFPLSGLSHRAVAPGASRMLVTGAPSSAIPSPMTSG